jgi:hypothetical protein
MDDPVRWRLVSARHGRAVRAGALALLWGQASVVAAYVGPGGIISGIGSLVALVAVIVIAAAGFLWFPIKRLLKRRKARAESGPDA